MVKVLKVKECPFCGNDVEVLASLEGYCKFECLICGADVAFCPPQGKEEILDVKKSIETWNKRSESSKSECCPFCGEDVLLIAFPDIGNVLGCYYGCGASVTFCGAERNKEKLVEAWSRRA
ncbi:MAG: hypothetical protein IJS61_03410 [Firmicutes bacterium]|nr:hypothetical protein [Bacillota bacterium]